MKELMIFASYKILYNHNLKQQNQRTRSLLIAYQKKYTIALKFNLEPLILLRGSISPLLLNKMVCFVYENVYNLLMPNKMHSAIKSGLAFLYI